MPVYEYACKACGHEFEEWQKMSDPPVVKCPKCGKKKVEKLISRSSFQLKGGGWYSDLYSSSKGAKAEPSGDAASSSDGKSETKAEVKAESKSDSKSETKSESKSEAKVAAKPDKKEKPASTKAAAAK